MAWRARPLAFRCARGLNMWWNTVERGNGAESLARTLVDGDIDVSFTNASTSEIDFVAALDKIEGMRCILWLFEGVI